MAILGLFCTSLASSRLACFGMIRLSSTWSGFAPFGLAWLLWCFKFTLLSLNGKPPYNFFHSITDNSDNNTAKKAKKPKLRNEQLTSSQSVS